MKLSRIVSKRIKKSIGSLVLFSQVFSMLMPLATLAAPQAVSSGDIQNALETVGTKANRLKTVGSSGVDESSGAFTFSYPFSLPKGLLGLEPSITLAYNSQSAENSIIGYGWNMALPYIERTSKYGVDKIYTKNDFVSSLGGELILKSNTSNQYIQKIDDGSYQEYTLINNIFTLKDRSGNIYIYGQTVDSRLSDTTGAKIQKYYLTEVRDIMGNKIKYFYEKKNGFVYPKEIIYTVKKDGTYSNKIVFEREDRADKEISYKSGFRTEMTDRIKTIRAFTDNTEVAKLELVYTTGQNGTRSLLSNIKESRSGTDGVWTAIPETKFEYEKTIFDKFVPNLSISPGQGYLDINGDAKPESFSLTSGVSTGASMKVADINGDSFPDSFYHLSKQTYCNGYCGNNWLPAEGNIKLSQGDGNYLNFGMDKIASLNIPATADYHWWYRGVDNNSLFIDVNGDGLQDIINNDVYLKNNENFVSSSLQNLSGYKTLADVNGDGLPDKITNREVFLNNGSGWNVASDTLFKVPLDFEVDLGSSWPKFDAGVRFVDLNGDGLVDIARSYSITYGYACCGNTYPSTVTANDVYLNDGSSWVQSSLKLSERLVTTNYIIPLYGEPTPENTWKDFSPVNPDGTDYIKKQDILKAITSPLGAKSEITYKGSSQQNNPKLPINILTVSEIKNTEVNINLVETTKYSYENGKMYFDKNNVYDRRFAGFQKVTTETGTGANLKKTVKYFHQGDGDDVATYERGDSFHNIGRVYKEEVYGGTAKFAETYRTYGVYNWDGQIYKYPKLEVSTEFDANGNSFSKAVTYDYDLASRLPKKTENFGEVKWDITSGNFTDVGEDYILTKNIYNTKRPQKLLAEESLDVNGKFLDKKLYFYDELPFGYVEKGLLSEERNYYSVNNYVKSTYTYHPTGLVATKTENNGAVTSFSYDANYNPTTVTNALGQLETTQYSKVLGVVTSSTNANGKVTNTVYDGFGTVKSVSQTSPKDDEVKLVATKSVTYTGNGMTETESIFNNGAVHKTSTKIYDSFGRLIKSQNTNTENSNQTIDVNFNNLGQMVKVSYPYDSNGLLAGYFSGYDTNYEYDSLGRNISVSQGDLTNYTDYLINGKITRDNTPEQHKKEYRYNSLGKLSSVKEYMGSSNYNETKYEWNLLGNLAKLTDALGNVRNFQYDSEGRLLKQEDLHASTDNTFATYTYTYDVNGNLISKKDPSDNVATYEYDLLNRPKKESFGVVSDYVYDSCQNGVGALCEVSNSDYTQKLKYTKAGNISSETKNIDGKTFVQMYEYNDLGQNTKIVLPDASYISYTYDVNGKQKSASLTRMINNTASTSQIVTSANYNIDGTIKNYISGNGVKTCYEYSSQNGGSVLPRLSKINIINNSSNNNCDSFETDKLLFGQDLKYNLFGSIIENKETFGANNFNSGVAGEVLSKYEYDVLQRLTKTDRLENSLNVVNNLSYNSIGNILSSDSTQYSYTGADYQNPNAPSVIGTTQMTYDLNGNILSDNKNQYEWNVKNTLKRVANEKSVSEYTYDVSGERIKEVVKTKLGNSSTTFSMDTGTENYVEEEVFTNFANLGTTSTANLFMSKLAYDEIKNALGVATVTKQDIVNLLLPVQSTKFISETCATIIFNQRENCERDNVLKVVYSKYIKEKNIEISYGTLEEIWLVYKNKLKIDGEVYLPKINVKVFDYTDTIFKYYFTQQNYFSDYYTQPWCNIMESLNNNYVCNYIFTNNFIPKYQNLEVEKSEFTFASQNIIPASTTKISNLLNIDLASTTKYATTSNANSAYAASAGLVSQWNYYLYKVDVTRIVTAWINSTSTNVGLSIRNEPVTPSNMNFTLFGPNSNNWTKELLPTLSTSYKFTGEFKQYNSTTTKIIANESVDSYYNSYINNTKAQETKKISETYISENSYLELEKNKLNSQNKVEALFALAIEGNKYVKETCKLPANTGDINCQKKEAIKFVASYLYIKHNIKLSAISLDEMYEVYVGNLRVSRSADVYDKVLEPTIISNGVTNNNLMSYYYLNSQLSFQHIVSNINISNIPNSSRLLSYLNLSWGNRIGSQQPIVLFIDNEKIAPNLSNSTSTRLDLSSLIAKKKQEGKTSIKIELQYLQDGTVSGGNIYAYVNSVTLNTNIFEYKNININKNINPIVTTTDLNTIVYGDVSLTTTDKNLLSAIYKQKKLASLFGSDRLISKESFTEMSAFGFGYSDLIIKDMLIDVSFAPYASCEQMTNEMQKRNCRKEIFVKYLFAIVKYEYDKELSAVALDELFEATEGNLSLPNNLEDYKIRNTQVFTLNSTEKTHVLESYYGYGVDTNSAYMTGCQSGYSIPGQLYVNNICDISFVIPTELQTRKNEVELATVQIIGTQGRGDYSSPSVFNPGQVYFLPIISNNTFSYNANGIPPVSAFYDWNANPNYATTPVNIMLGEKVEADITNVVNAIIKGEVNNFGLRIISTGHNINYTNAGKYDLRVNFVKDAPQNEAKFYTPLVANPKDSTIYEHVLQELARVDKDYKSQVNDIISKEAWNEIKNSNIKTNTEVINIFDINEKLQKDDTLAAVYGYVAANHGINLTRETLEELFMVFESRLSMPEDFKQYDFTAATTSKIFYEKASWEVYSQSNSGTKTDYTCTVNTTSKCFLKLPDFSKSYLTVNSAILTLKGGGQYNDIRINAIIEPLATGTYLSAAKLNSETLSVNYTSPVQKFDLTKIYNSYANNEYGKYGLIINNNGYSVPGLDLLVNNNHFIEVFTTPNFKVFDRTKLENLSVVPGVPSVRSLADDDFIEGIKIISPETRAELDEVGIKMKQDIYPFITLTPDFGDASKISRTEKIAYLKNIFDNIKVSKSISLSREALEEIYFVINNKLFFSLGADVKILQDNFNRANSSIIGKDWVENYDGGDNLRITDNNLNMVWNNQPWGNFKSVYQNLSQHNDIKISYKWKVAPGATVDGYYPYVGVRSNGGNTNADSYGAALFYYPQVDRIDIHIYNNGTLIKNAINVVSSPKVNTNYDVEINIDSNNHMEFRIWEEGTTKPTSPSTNWNNGGTPFYPSSSGNKITILTMHGSRASHSANVMMDEFSVSKLTTESNPELYISTDIFDRTSFSSLEPVVGVASTNELSKTENITYDIFSTEIKNISAETVEELKLVNITTKQQIVDIFNLSETTIKDAKISFFNDYHQAQNQYSFSREALEEIYLVYINKAIFILNPQSNTIIRETIEVTNISNPGCILWMNSCEFEFKLTKKYGYNLKKVDILISGDKLAGGQSNWPVNILINGVKRNVASSISLETFSAYQYDVPIKGKMFINGHDVGTNVYLSANPGNPKIELIYEPITAISEKENFGELVQVAEGIIFATSTVANTTETISPIIPTLTSTTTASSTDNILTGIDTIIPGLYSGTTTNITITSTSSIDVSTTTLISTTEKITRWIGSTETEIGPHQYDEFNSNSESPTYSVNNNDSPNYSLNNLRKFIGKAHIPLVQRFEFTNLAIGEEQSLAIVVAATFNNKPYGLRAVSGNATFPNGNTFIVPGSLPDTFNYYTYNRNVIKFIPETKDLTLEIYSTVQDVKNHFFPDMYFANLVIPKTSLITSTTTQIIENTNQIVVDNPNSYPYTYENNIPVFYISTSPLATSTNAHDTPCTLNLATCKSLQNTVSGILKNYEEDNAYFDHLTYTKYYPSQFYEYDTRGITTINIPFNGKIVATVKYGYNNHSFNSGSDVKVDCTLPNSNCTLYTELSYLHNNYLATPVIITDVNASTTNVIKSDVWGSVIHNQINSNTQTKTEFGLSGHKWDDQSELTYAHARFLSNKNKVWLSHDPFSINNFTNGTWLMNPQIQNSYSYASNNPVNLVDPDGRIPTTDEAARMSQRVYGEDSLTRGNLIGGWTYDYSTYGSDRMKYATFWRAKDDGSTEYALAYRGTVNGQDWKNNFQQPFGISKDAQDAINMPGSFMKNHSKDEVTFLGHSKGGAEAQLAAVKYNRNGIVFNSALPFFDTNGLSSEYERYTGTIQSVNVSGEILGRVNNYFFGATSVPFVQASYLPSTNYNIPSLSNNFGIMNANSTSVVGAGLSPFASVTNSVWNHYMSSVNNGLKK